MDRFHAIAGPKRPLLGLALFAACACRPAPPPPPPPPAHDTVQVAPRLGYHDVPSRVVHVQPFGPHGGVIFLSILGWSSDGSAFAYIRGDWVPESLGDHATAQLVSRNGSVLEAVSLERNCTPGPAEAVEDAAFLARIRRWSGERGLRVSEAEVGAMVDGARPGRSPPWDERDWGPLGTFSPLATHWAAPFFSVGSSRTLRFLARDGRLLGDLRAKTEHELAGIIVPVVSPDGERIAWILAGGTDRVVITPAR